MQNDLGGVKYLHLQETYQFPLDTSSQSWKKGRMWQTDRQRRIIGFLYFFLSYGTRKVFSVYLLVVYLLRSDGYQRRRGQLERARGGRRRLRLVVDGARLQVLELRGRLAPRRPRLEALRRRGLRVALVVVAGQLVRVVAHSRARLLPAVAAPPLDHHGGRVLRVLQRLLQQGDGLRRGLRGRQRWEPFILFMANHRIICIHIFRYIVALSHNHFSAILNLAARRPGALKHTRRY